MDETQPVHPSFERSHLGYRFRNWFNRCDLNQSGLTCGFVSILPHPTIILSYPVSTLIVITVYVVMHRHVEHPMFSPECYTAVGYLSYVWPSAGFSPLLASEYVNPAP